MGRTRERFVRELAPWGVAAEAPPPYHLDRWSFNAETRLYDPVGEGPLRIEASCPPSPEYEPSPERGHGECIAPNSYSTRVSLRGRLW